MPALPNPRHEAFARGRAEGLCVRAAGLKGDYHNCGGFLKRKEAQEPFQTRIAELRETLGLGETRDIRQVIDQLGIAARKALAQDSLAALKIGGELLKAVADLKRRLPPDAEPFEREEPPMTPEEWMKTFNPGA